MHTPPTKKGIHVNKNKENISRYNI